MIVDFIGLSSTFSGVSM